MFVKLVLFKSPPSIVVAAGSAEGVLTGGITWRTFRRYSVPSRVRDNSTQLLMIPWVFFFSSLLFS